MTRSWGMCGTENWVRERKFLFLLYSSFRGITESCLLCLPRWVGCQWSKTSWWEGDGKCPGKGKAPLLIWPCWCMVWYWRAMHPIDPSPHTVLQSWKPTFFRGKLVHMDSSCHKQQLGHFIGTSFSTCRCSSPALRTAWSPWKCGIRH